MGALFSTNQHPSTDYAAGKKVLITGASTGIGATLARQFAKQGANLALLARNAANLQTVAEECLASGAPRAEVFSCDLTDDQKTKTAIEMAIKSFDSFDIIVLNAGRSMGCYFEEIRDAESISYMLKLNVNGVIHALWCALPAIPKSETSRIVIISSVSGLIGIPYRTIYCASKHAINGFANALRIELNDTYGASKAPKVQIINFPEVLGTNLNNGRMDMGASRPPARLKETGGVTGLMTCETACGYLIGEIEKGTNEWGQPLKFWFAMIVRLFVAPLVDSIILKFTKRTHIRPDSHSGGAIEKKSQ